MSDNEILALIASALAVTTGAFGMQAALGLRDLRRERRWRRAAEARARRLSAQLDEALR